MSTKFKLDAVAIVFAVKNLDRTHTFYREVIGLELEKHEDHLLGKLPGCEFVFFEGEAKPGGSPQVVFGIAEGGIDTLAERLVKQGVQVLTPVTEAPEGWVFELADPDEHRLAFFQYATLPRTRDA